MVLSQPPPLPIRTNKLRERLKPTPGDPSAREVLEDICRVFGVSEEALMSESKEEDVVKYRRLYFYVANVLTSVNSTRISALINRDRGTYLWHLGVCVSMFESGDDKFIALWNIYTKGSLIWNTHYNRKNKAQC